MAVCPPTAIVDIRSQRIDFRLTVGEPLDIQLAFVDLDGVPVDLTDYAFTHGLLTVAGAPVDPSPFAMVVDAGAGTVVLSLSGAQTLALGTGNWSWWLAGAIGGGEASYWLGGTVGLYSIPNYATGTAGPVEVVLSGEENRYMSRLRVVFMGSPDFSKPTLQAIMDAGHEVICVYAQPPRPAGRGQKERPCPVHEFAAARNLMVRTPPNLKDAAEHAAFAELKADIAVVVAYGLILPESILKAPRLGCINVHASLLPRWRGAAPIQRAIQAGDAETGVCIMQMDKGLDTGPVYLRRRIVIETAMTGGMLHDSLSVLGGAACVEVLDGLSGSGMTAEPQSKSGVTYAAKLSSGEARIDWNLSADDIARTVLAFDPWPGTWFEHNGERIKVLSASADTGSGSGSAGKPGEVLDGRPTVACGRGAETPFAQTAVVETFLRCPPHRRWCPCHQTSC